MNMLGTWYFSIWKKQQQKKPNPNETNHSACNYSSGKEKREHDLHVTDIGHMTWSSPGKCL